MSTYIMLPTLTPEGRHSMLEDPDNLLRAQAAAGVRGIDVPGVYGVLGEHDFVHIVEAPNHE